MLLDAGLIVTSSVSGAALTASAFYVLTNWRLKKLEDAGNKNDDTRDRVIRIEGMVQLLYKEKTGSRYEETKNSP